MKSKIFIFFALVFGFCAFGDSVSDCLEQQQAALEYISSAQTANDVTGSIATQIIGNTTEDLIRGLALSLYDSKGQVDDNLLRLHSAVGSISCNASNDTCSVDLGPLVDVCSNIYDVVSFEKICLQAIFDNTDLLRLTQDDIFNILVRSSYSSGNVGYFKVFDSNLLSAVSNFNNDVTSSFDVLTNQIANLDYKVDNFLNSFDSNFRNLLLDIQGLDIRLHDISSYLSQIRQNVGGIQIFLLQYLPYLETISNDLKLIVTNGTFQADYDFTNQLYSSSLLGFDRFRFYAQGQANNNSIQLYPLSPYDTASNLRNATIYDALSSGFASLLISQGSINNYLYWLKAMAGSNRLEAVEAHLVAVSNLVGRLDDYVLGDFSNEVSRLVETLSYVTNRVDYTTNLVEIASLLQTSTNHLASIDSKLDVLDYIKVLSNTPLSDFSGGSYYDYLTNLYLNGASSAAPTTNWFERIEILLASMVFGDSASSSISNEVEFTNFSEETIENAFNDYTFQSELNSGIGLVENTGENFLTILRGFHDSFSSVTQPQSISIGIGGLDGQDTKTYEDVMHGHFQVSFNSGSSDKFTLIVRSMTTIIWILVTMMFVYFSARWLLSKVLFFYRLMRTLITSLFLK